MLVNESGPSIPSSPPLLTVTVQGTGIGDIPVRIVPMTYEQFQTNFTSSLLDQLFPARPINSAGGKISLHP